MMLAILVNTLVFLLPNTITFISFYFLLPMSVSGEGYYKNAMCALNSGADPGWVGGGGAHPARAPPKIGKI
jgi:hypothetical protein